MGLRSRSGLGSLVMSLLAGLLVGLLASAASAQLSPGALSEAHAALDGSRGCLECHAPSQGVSAALCLDCHGALAARLEADAGLHARAGFERCETCHIEHHGREFELIYWPGLEPLGLLRSGAGEGRAAFDHRATGWPLVGAHAEASCRDCHQPRFVEDAAALRRGGADPSTTFLGLPTACLGCHRDEHRGQLAGPRSSSSQSPTSCLNCHVRETWDPAPGFDHASTAFPLTGRHERVACGGCHPTETDGGMATVGGRSDTSFLRVSGIDHASCTSCHDDPHQGRLGSSCSDCHTTEAWSRVATADFDHSRTRFPLVGEHRGVACASCHRQDRALRFETCADCHTDPHRGRFGSSCAQCHDPSGWREGVRESFDHDLTDFPLRGEHRGLACAACHGGGGTSRALAHEACSDCHADPHRGQLAVLASGTRPVGCASCHTVDGFVPSTFTVERHQDGPFPLEGAHRAVACVACHTMTDPDAPPERVRAFDSRRSLRSTRSARPSGPVRRFRFESTSCARCHADPHQGAMTRLVDGAGCDACHSVDDWSRVSLTSDGLAGFDHASTGFPLAGAHAELSCARCHGGAEARAGAALRFERAASACASCHRDPHFDSLASTAARATADAVACDRCHGTAAWRPSSFDHARDTGFILEGAHRRLGCASCHVLGRDGPRATLRLAPLPTTCEGCHGGVARASIVGSSRDPSVVVTFRSSSAP